MLLATLELAAVPLWTESGSMRPGDVGGADPGMIGAQLALVARVATLVLDVRMPSVAPSPEGKDRRQRLLAAVRSLAEREGAVPGIRRFCEEVGETRQQWNGVLWPSWREFLREAGLAPGQMTSAVPEAKLLGYLADLTREFGKFPTNAQLRYARNTRPDLPTEKVFRVRFGRQEEMVAALLTWVAGKPEYADVQALLRATPVSTRKASAPSAEEGRAQPGPISESFVPPVVDCLPGLAEGDADIERQCVELGIEPSVELERRTAIAFSMLGLEVKSLGQGAGRVADGLALCRPGRWALVYDAKVRRGGFTMGTEDRKFREYIERHGRSLLAEGIEAIYFVVISSSFDEDDLAKAREIVRLTKAKAFVLLEAAALRALVGLRLEGGLIADWASLERVFAETRAVGIAALTA